MSSQAPDHPSEELIDATLAATFPASDPPAWPAGHVDAPPPNAEVPMAIAKADAEWTGTLKEGSGRMRVASGVLDGPFTYKSRFEGDTKATNPEELLGAAHAGCFSMFLAAQLTTAGFPPTRIATQATVHLGAGPAINRIELTTDAVVPGITQAVFDEKVAASKAGCPVSKALAGVADITVVARLQS
jgi:osmotically inducible protein OsmC